MENAIQRSDSISLPDALSIRNISDVHQRITEHLANNKSLVLDVSSAKEADLSFVQLLESARIYAEANGKSIRLASPAAGSVLTVLQRGGFVDAFSAADAQFWLHEEVKQ